MLHHLTTWNTTQPNEAIELPQILPQTSLTVDWGDSTTQVISGANVSPNHTYATPGLHNVSINGRFFWTGGSANTTKAKLVDILSWGDGFLVDATSSNLFSSYLNLHVSAPPNTQPVFLSGASLQFMFHNSSFNSPLNWDLTNVTSLFRMFRFASLVNQPITFRNTQGVTTINSMFSRAVQFNQPFHLDASGLIDAAGAFLGASSFNQIVNLSNSHQLTSVSGMFGDATAFNQPLFLNTDSVTTMEGMFSAATSFNQPVNFNTSQVTTMAYMFANAVSFNQPINFSYSPKLVSTEVMFQATRINQPVVMDTANVTTMFGMFQGCDSFASTVNFTSISKVTSMGYMFSSALNFTQDLSSWNVSAVVECTLFCPWCGLPSFGACTPCQGGGPYNNGQGVSVCSTRSPTTTFPTIAPSTAAPTIAPSTPAPTIAPTTAAPSTVAPTTAAPSTIAPSTAAPSPAAPSAAPSVAVVQDAAAASPSEGLPDWLVILIVCVVVGVVLLFAIAVGLIMARKRKRDTQ